MATAASARADKRPTISVSTTPIAMKPSCTSTTGTASATVARNSECSPLIFERMRISLVVTVAMLVFARDSAAQNVSVMAQAIPTITSARPTATRGNLTEAYLTQPAIMVHASWAGFTGIGTLNLEGLTLERGELTTGAYGEGYVDRRHPHAYVHELLAGRDVTATRDFSFSVFGGRGFAPFGSDDPMVRPIEKYPVNHHLSQVLERIVGVGALRYRKTMLEVGTFNGDEPLGPG